MARKRTQPVRPIPTGEFGGSAETAQMQQARPLPAEGGIPPVGPPAAAPPMAAQPMTAPDIFAPTMRPDEPPTAGIPYGPGSPGGLLPDDGLGLLRALYQEFPNEDIRRLLERAAARSANL